MIHSSGEERRWLRRHGIAPRKRLGQNFLVRPDVAGRLAERMPIGERTEVVEIGAGGGALTRALLERGATVHAVEIDLRLVSLLEDRFRVPISEGRLRLHAGSILDLDPASLARKPGGRLYAAGNLPYAITTPILLWLLGARSRLDGAAVLVQREVADRLTSAPGDPAYGSLTVWISYHAGVGKLAGVRRGSFWPVPSVDSTLIALSFHRRPPVPLRRPEHLELTLRATFGKRRKMLRASLAHALGDPARAMEVLAGAGIDPERRPETLDLAEFAALANVAGPLLR